MKIFIVDDSYADRLEKYKVIYFLKGTPKNRTNIKDTKRQLSLEALFRAVIIPGERFYKESLKF